MTPWEDNHPHALARIAGALGIAFVVYSLVSLGGPLFDALSNRQIVDWATHHGREIVWSAFLDSVGVTAVAVFLIALVVLARGRGLLAAVAYVGISALVAINWVHTGVAYALADTAQRAEAAAGVLALFSLDKAMTFTDGFVTGLALVALCLLSLRARSLPAALAWLGMVVGVFHLIGTPLQLALTGDLVGITGPISVVLILLWILAASVVLIVWPSLARPRPSPMPAPAC